MLWKIPYKILTCKLGKTIHALRPNRIKLCIRSCSVSGKNIVCRHMYKLSVIFFCGNGKISRTNSINLISKLPVNLTRINRCVCRTVHYRIRLNPLHESKHCVYIRYIKLSNIRVHKLIPAIAVQHLIHGSSKLSVAPGYYYFLHSTSP